jgi:hypothetical protein
MNADRFAVKALQTAQIVSTTPQEVLDLLPCVVEICEMLREDGKDAAAVFEAMRQRLKQYERPSNRQ